jgi:hypothetical protein
MRRLSLNILPTNAAAVPTSSSSTQHHDGKGQEFLIVPFSQLLTDETRTRRSFERDNNNDNNRSNSRNRPVTPRPSHTPQLTLLAWSAHAHCHDRSLPVYGTAVNPLLRAAYLQPTNTEINERKHHADNNATSNSGNTYLSETMRW